MYVMQKMWAQQKSWQGRRGEGLPPGSLARAPQWAHTGDGERSLEARLLPLGRRHRDQSWSARKGGARVSVLIESYPAGSLQEEGSTQNFTYYIIHQALCCDFSMLLWHSFYNQCIVRQHRPYIMEERTEAQTDCSGKQKTAIDHSS